MSNIGLDVMIKRMTGNDTTFAALAGSVGKTITGLSIEGNESLNFSFGDGSKLTMRDDGQSCCEYRHMSTDDDLEYYIGSQFMDVEIKEGPSTDTKYGDCSDSEFLEIKTSKGVFTVVNHNEHNGYYGGFYIVARASK